MRHLIFHWKDKKLEVQNHIAFQIFLQRLRPPPLGAQIRTTLTEVLAAPASMVRTDEAAPPPGSRHSNLKRSFKLGVRSLLTAVSKEDVYKAFPTFSNVEKERLHRMLIQVIKSLHENIEEEFEALCLETQVGSTLDTIERLVEEQSLDTLSAEALNVGEIKEKLSRVKKDEICYLTSLLEKVEMQNDLMKARIESLRKGKEDALAATDVISKLRSWNSNHEKLLNSCCSKFNSG